MRRYRRLQIFAVAVLLFELVAGLSGELTRQREFFPFTSWFLFILVPDRTADFDLILRAQNGLPVTPPRSYADMAGLVGQPHSIVSYQLIQQFGRAEDMHDAARSRELRRQIESQFFVPAVRYDLVRMTYSPVERWRTGRVLQTEVLRSFLSGEP